MQVAGSRVAPLDLLDLDASLSAEEREIRAVVRQVVDARVRPHVARWYEDGQLPARELAVEFGKLGLLGMHLTGYGCAGASAVAYGLACFQTAGHFDDRILAYAVGDKVRLAIQQDGPSYLVAPVVVVGQAAQ